MFRVLLAVVLIVLFSWTQAGAHDDDHYHDYDDDHHHDDDDNYEEYLLWGLGIASVTAITITIIVLATRHRLANLADQDLTSPPALINLAPGKELRWGTPTISIRQPSGGIEGSVALLKVRF